jgi:hypothetical protein
MVYMAKTRKKTDRHVNDRRSVRIPEPYGQLLEELAKKGRRGMTEELIIALENRAAEVGVPVPQLPDDENN